MKGKLLFKTPTFIGVALTFLLAACQLSGVVTTQPTATSAPIMTTVPAVITPIPTQTTIPVSTPTPAKPTGELIFTDTFEDGGMWKGATSVSGNIIAGGDKLTLAVKSRKGWLLQLRKDWPPPDYYMEVTAEVRLCRGEDVIGILFRAPGEQSGYRLLINCNGQISIQQVVGGTPTNLVEWTQSGMLTPGLPFPVDIGVLMRGKTMRIYLDQVLQLELTRDLFREGSMGFYARAAEDTPLTVNFYNLKVYQPPLEETLPAGTGTAADFTPTP